MQDRYVGDVGDFGKYALLRTLCGNTGSEQSLSLGVVWCLFPNEIHNSDGRHISYLSRGEFRALDPALFDCLRRIVLSKNRCVSAIEESGVFSPGTVFFGVPTSPQKAAERPSPTKREEYRKSWLTRCLNATGGCEIVFLDPDNGLATPSVGKRYAKAGKYLFWDELDAFTARQQSVIIYHHFNRRTSATEQVGRIGGELRRRLPSPKFHITGLVYRRGSRRVFWLVVTRSLAKTIENRVDDFLSSGWGKHFELGYRG